ncbi:hypothetical protein A0H81_02417 [Grifola frondosa]|uniref:RNA-dependent RNA polymerase n=1 Tax=Grifola frondosa TaxID=5627 RepID=A0A1C7MMP6_GRIFR|nr:hypothetical protein A0H81_02417 [Grifola frondosa]
MARLITTGTFDYDCFSDAALEHLCTFRTSREAVSEVLKLANKDNTGFKLEAKFLHYFNEEKNAKCPWKELDKEDASLHEDPYGSLGCCNKGGRDPDWYGGQVNFSAKLLYSEIPGEQFKMALERPTLGASNRFTRRYGSRRFIRVRFDKSDMLYKHGSNALEYFKHPFIICGRVFRAFYFKEHVTLIDTNEQFEAGRILAAEPGKNLFLDILAFHNPLELNKGQASSVS